MEHGSGFRVDLLDAYHPLLSHYIGGLGQVQERPLVVQVAGELGHHHDLGLGGRVAAHLHERCRFQGVGDGHLADVDARRDGGGYLHRHRVADADGELSKATFDVRLEVALQDAQHHVVVVDLHHAVVRGVEAVVGVVGQHDGRGDVGAAVEGVVRQDRQHRQAVAQCVVGRRVTCRWLRRLRHRLGELGYDFTRLNPQAQRHQLARRGDVGHHRHGAALDVLEEQCPPIELLHQRRYLVDGVHFARYARQQPLLVQFLYEFPHVHGITRFSSVWSCSPPPPWRRLRDPAARCRESAPPCCRPARRR